VREGLQYFRQAREPTRIHDLITPADLKDFLKEISKLEKVMGLNELLAFIVVGGDNQAAEDGADLSELAVDSLGSGGLGEDIDLVRVLADVEGGLKKPQLLALSEVQAEWNVLGAVHEVGSRVGDGPLAERFLDGGLWNLVITVHIIITVKAGLVLV